MNKTSKSHPLRIDAVKPMNCSGLIGMTFCPGKKQCQAMSGGDWDRDLDTDLEAMFIRFPIVDGGIPCGAARGALNAICTGLRQRLSRGERIVIHCKGGLGRTGLIAARLLIEFGEDPESAILRVRAARRGAIETAQQEQYLMKRSWE